MDGFVVDGWMHDVLIDGPGGTQLEDLFGKINISR